MTDDSLFAAASPLTALSPLDGRYGRKIGCLTWALVTGQTCPPALSIPPNGWSSVDILVRDYKKHLEELGHKAVVIDTDDPRAIVAHLHDCQPDIVHLHYPPLAGVLRNSGVAANILTFHHASALNTVSILDFFRNHFAQYLRGNLFFFALSPAWEKLLLECGIDPRKIFVTPNGVDCRRFKFRKTPRHKNRSIYLGVVCNIKRQRFYQSIESVDFVGPLLRRNMGNFDETRKNYLGIWTREHLYAHLSDYANLVILSRAESAAPLVVLEALVCGLGVVVSAGAAANLDTRLPWVSVIPEAKITDVEFVAAEIARNREIALRHREQIRAHAIADFSWEKQVFRYADLCMQLHAEQRHRRGAFARSGDLLRRLRYLPAGLMRLSPLIISRTLRAFISACRAWRRRMCG